MRVEIDHLAVAFGRTLALDDVELEIGPGITGLFGPNGSGKSTLLRAICGLIRPSSGRVLLDGTSMTLKNEGLRARIGYAGHESGLYPQLTLVENLTLFARLYGISDGRVGSVIDDLALHHERETQVSALSAGTKRRAAVARALLHDPDLLLLDEPYANVDDDAADRVTAAIVRWSSSDKIAIVATHGAKKVRPYATSGVVMQRGRVARYGAYAGQPA
ncbi:MAG TPA: heme ABC exporter ATP-binding protein CcmA [Actinomycetota bacterium]|nr:heme ABC exporter ATP-binding protein CcmA [Actinomycetota bacterium]